jgi:hypothetical protein
MPPPSTSSALHLKVLRRPFRIFKLEPSTPFPLALLGVMQKPSTNEFMSITRNAEEVSVVTDHAFVKSDELGICEEGGLWRCIKVQGPMEHSRYFCPFDLITATFGANSFNWRNGSADCAVAGCASADLCDFHMVCAEQKDLCTLLKCFAGTQTGCL